MTSVETTGAPFAVPGTDAVLYVERDPRGHLRRLSGGGRTYVDEHDGARHYDDLAVVVEAAGPRGLLRRVDADDHRWVEEYRWDGTDRLAWVDGVAIERDEAGRIVTCASDSGRWYYGYAEGALCVIDGPGGRRLITSGVDGRPVRVRQDAHVNDIRYRPDGYRVDLGADPSSWRRDAAGRLWAVVRSNGDIVAIYLWDGYACLGRIDGPPGAPLAAFFCLDPTGTPVRIVGRDAVVRVPRDAFGEALLSHPGVPGLFGGAVHDGRVHLPSRVLDPIVGAFCSPDPWHGGADDPRRADGYRGPLAVETPRAGPYAVARHDPVGRADPTAAVSWYLPLSDFTWSLQNNLVSFLGLDYWFSLFLSPFAAAKGSSPFSTDAISSTGRIGSYGLRRDGILAVMTGGRPFTTQHLVWAPANEFDDRLDGRVIDPAGEFRPRLYNSVLLARPEDADPFLLRGMANPADASMVLPSWSRCGGTAERVVPGSVVATFPRGGLHLDANAVRTGVRGPRACPLKELAPTGAPSTGTFDDRVVVTLPDSVTAPTVGDSVWLEDAAGVMAITTVVSVVRAPGSFTVRLQAEAPGLGPTGVRLRELVGAAASTDPRSAVATIPGNIAFDSRGAAATYTVGDLIRVVGPPDTVALVTRLEARIRLDAPLPGALTAPLTVTAATGGGALVAGATIGADPSVLVFSATSSRPAPGQAIVVSAVATPAVGEPVIVGDPEGGDGLRVDRSLSSLGPPGTAVRWRTLVAGAPLGVRAEAPEADPVLTYAPVTPGQAPATEFVRVDSARGVAVRAVTGLDHDAVVLGAALPAGAGPFTVERWLTEAGGTDASNLTVTRAIALVAQPELPAATESILLLRLTGPAVAAGPTLVPNTLIAGVTATGVARDPGAAPAVVPGNTPQPSQLVVLQRAGDVELAIVQTVKLTVTFDRDLTVADPADVVLLDDAGPTYRANRLGPARVSVRPVVQAGGGNVDVEMPRFVVGEHVHLTFNGGDAWLRVAAVEGTGTTLDLDGGAPLPDPTPNLRLRRLVPIDPKTGGSRIGREAESVAGQPRQLQIAVWQPDAFPPDRVVGIVVGDRTLPARVVGSRQDLALEFTAAPALTGNGVDICAAPLDPAATGYSARFARDGQTVTVLDPPAGLAAGPNLVVVVPFGPSGVEAAGAILHSGTVLHPQDPEHSEVDRRQSLVDHELTHTLQYSRLGPWWFGYFPLWAVELGLELGTDIEEPEFSPYLPATVEEAGGARLLGIPNPGSTTFAKDDEVQVSTGGTPVMVNLGNRQADGKFVILHDSTQIPTGDVFVRKHTPSTWWRNGIFNALQLTSHGGLLNIAVGSTWAGLTIGLAKLFYALGRAIFGTGDTHEATVAADGRELQLTTEAGRAALAGASRVVVRKGNDTVVRSSTVSENTVTLDARVTFTDTVQVATFSSHDPSSAWDWHTYHPAHSPDRTRPAAIVIDDDLELRELDRVTVTTGENSKRATVTAASGNNVELTEGPDLRGDETTFRIAKIDETDPFGNADSMAMQELGMGWMRWLFDPYGQIQMRVQPEQTGLSVFLHSLRYLFGTKSWSLLPLFGYVWYERLFRSDEESAHRAALEQEASEESGDLYSPIGRLRGEINVVGDVARYWYFPVDSSATFVQQGLQDAPGVHLDPNEIRVCPDVDAAGAGTAADPNGTAETPAGATTPGAVVPDALAAKNANDPTSTNGIEPRGLNPSPRAFVPASAILERTIGAYVGFTRPGTHRVTTRNGIDGADKARDLHDRLLDNPIALAFWEQHGTQTLFFDVSVADVVVRVAGAETAAAVELVVGQRATVDVQPGNDRVYAVTVRQPLTSAILRVADDNVLVAQGPGTAEPVEVSRLYEGGNPGGGFATHGLHLDDDVHVPVRRFNVDVVTTLAMRSDTDPASAAVPSFRAGAVGFVLVPAGMTRGLRLVMINGNPPAAADPQPRIEPEEVPSGEPGAALRAFIGDGGVFRVTFPAAAPAANQALVFDAEVRIDGGIAVLTCAVEFAT